MADNNTILEKLEGLVARFEEVSTLITDPAVIADQKRYVKLTKEYKELGDLMNARKEYMQVLRGIEEAKEIIANETDAEMREMAREELDACQARQPELEEEIKLLLVPADPQDSRNAILEIRGGAGGDEAAIFAGDLFRMYTKYCESKGWKMEISSANEGAAGGFKEIVCSVTGDNVYGTLKYESGVHRVQRVPETETQGRIHTSTATVAVMPQAEEVDLVIDPKDLRIDTFRSSGAGGQHINKTSSAVRLIHKPTGIVVSCQTQRDQFQNRETCMRMLRSKLIEIKEREHLDKISDIKGAQLKIEWGSQIRNYVFMPYTLVKDTRTGFETSNVNAVMDGALDGFINAYLTAEATGTLASK